MHYFSTFYISLQNFRALGQLIFFSESEGHRIQLRAPNRDRTGENRQSFQN